MLVRAAALFVHPCAHTYFMSGEFQSIVVIIPSDALLVPPEAREPFSQRIALGRSEVFLMFGKGSVLPAFSVALPLGL